MRKHRVSLSLSAVLLLCLLWFASAQAQVQDPSWSQPYRLSSDAGRSSEGYSVADQYGYVHTFWTESLYADDRTIIQYARFDGAAWSTPNEIRVTLPLVAIKNVSPVVDQNGTLHIAWAEGLSGPAYYTYAPAYGPISARTWAPRVRIGVPARQLHLRIDAAGVLHMVYINQTEDPGVFYIRSEDHGATWSEPIWLDPDILPAHIPNSLSFELDSTGGLHAAWFYSQTDFTTKPDWVRYTHSFDGGNTWSSPFLIDHLDAAAEYDLDHASPIMTVQGQTVHVIWAAGHLPYRQHRFSTDAGRTWSPRRQIFGELHGQAFDGFAIDGAGRVHFVGHIRYPMAIYHAYWDQMQWTQPSLIYLIQAGDAQADAQDATVEEVEAVGETIAAHDTHLVVRAGNQLVLTFGDSPGNAHRRLFVMHRILDDIAPLATAPTPTPMATPTLAPSSTPALPTRTPTPAFDPAAAQPLDHTPGWNLAIWMAILPALAVLAGIVVAQLWFKLKP
jgi:hypothetical protein